MSNCSEHKKEVLGISDMKILAEMIGDLHYETLAELFDCLCDKIHSDGAADILNGKSRLGMKLLKAAHRIEQAYTQFEKAWQISQPFMEPKK